METKSSRRGFSTNMNSFDEATMIERAGLDVLHPYACRFSDDGKLLVNCDRETQKDLGDFSVLIGGDRRWVECKIEQRFTGNLFLETWSNRQRFTPGWLHTSQADVLWYYFLDTERLYTVPMDFLKKWAFGYEDEVGQHRANVYNFAEKPQSKRNQLNDTWGRIVPIANLTIIPRFKGPLSPKYCPNMHTKHTMFVS